MSLHFPVMPRLAGCLFLSCVSLFLSVLSVSKSDILLSFHLHFEAPSVISVLCLSDLEL